MLDLEPSYILSGHIHYESYNTHAYWESEKVKKLTHEITVPTCSYRMGQQHMGAGVAVIGEFVELNRPIVL